MREFKLVPISEGGFVGRPVTPKTAARRSEEAFLALWEEMNKVRERVRVKQFDMFEGTDAKT